MIGPHEYDAYPHFNEWKKYAHISCIEFNMPIQTCWKKAHFAIYSMNKTAQLWGSSQYIASLCYILFLRNPFPHPVSELLNLAGAISLWAHRHIRIYFRLFKRIAIALFSALVQNIREIVKKRTWSVVRLHSRSSKRISPNASMCHKKK